MFDQTNKYHHVHARLASAEVNFICIGVCVCMFSVFLFGGGGATRHSVALSVRVMPNDNHQALAFREALKFGSMTLKRPQES